MPQTVLPGTEREQLSAGAVPHGQGLLACGCMNFRQIPAGVLHYSVRATLGQNARDAWVRSVARSIRVHMQDAPALAGIKGRMGEYKTRA